MSSLDCIFSKHDGIRNYSASSQHSPCISMKLMIGTVIQRLVSSTGKVLEWRSVPEVISPTTVPSVQGLHEISKLFSSFSCVIACQNINTLSGNHRKAHWCYGGCENQPSRSGCCRRLKEMRVWWGRRTCRTAEQARPRWIRRCYSVDR